MTKPVITLTCDFNDTFAPAQIALVIHSINPEVKFVVLSHEVTPYSIIEGAFMLAAGTGFAPPGSVHIGVVDPGVGSDRRGLIIKTKGGYFVGPDNGLLYQAAARDQILQVYRIDESKVGTICNTFHGRDVFAKCAAHILSGKDIDSFATKIQGNIKRFEFADGQILHIDPYGNLKVHCMTEYEIGDTLRLVLGGKAIDVPYVKTFADVGVGTPLAYSGSHSTLELAINQGDASEFFGVRVGEALNFR